MLTLGCLAGAEISLTDPPSGFWLRPGASATLGYQVIEGPATHTVAFSGVPASVTCTASIAGSVGIITIRAAAAAITAGSTIRMKAKSGSATIAEIDLPLLVVDPPPKYAGTILPILEDQLEVPRRFSMQDNTEFLNFQISSSVSLVAVIANQEGKSCEVALSPTPDFFGAATLVLRVTDALGPTDITIPITVTATNDPPVATLATLPTEVIADPIQGGAVRMAGDLSIGTGVDADVTRSAAGRFLGWEASVDGVDGIDLLTLGSSAIYTVTSRNIVRGSTTVASWERSDGDTRRLRVTLATDGSQAHLQDIAAMLRYVCVQGAADEQIRTLALNVFEPDGNGDVDISPAATATCRVLAQNAPPVVTITTLGVEPEQRVPVMLDITDSDDPTAIQVRLVKPLPRFGSVAPAVCTVAELRAGAMRYTHRDTDESADLINLTVDDGRNRPVAVQVPVQVRIVIDRMSLVSDPCLEVYRDTTLAWPLRFSCPASQVDVVAITGTMLALPAGAVTCDDAGALHFDWSRIPPDMQWLPVQVEASTSDPTIAAGLRRSVQRMLIRVQPRPAVGSMGP